MPSTSIPTPATTATIDRLALSASPVRGCDPSIPGGSGTSCQCICSEVE